MEEVLTRIEHLIAEGLTIQEALAAVRADRESFSLTFEEFRAAALRRTDEVFHPLGEWSLSEWTLAMCGEAGETANLVKKWRRGEAVDLWEVAKEVADTVIYAFHVAERAGFPLEKALVVKFNEVSARVGSKEYL